MTGLVPRAKLWLIFGLFLAYFCMRGVTFNVQAPTFTVSPLAEQYAKPFLGKLKRLRDR
jgi:hypothetical protein